MRDYWPYVLAAAALVGLCVAAGESIIERDGAQKNCAVQCGERLFDIERSVAHSPYHCLCMNDDGRYVPAEALEKNR
jgi:hypothetical protein